MFTWLPVVPTAGAYKIYANWPADASRPTDAVFNVIHAGGTTPVVVNQRQNGGQWHLLGTYTLDPGQNHGVDLESSTAGTVAADAIRIVADSATPQNVAYIHADHLATPQKMTDPSGTVVWDRDALPFGQTASLTGTGELPLRFPGQYYDDETGLYYNYFRDYDPSTGRYIQSDPIGLAGGLNTYAYVGGNPINATDPYGESWRFVFWGVNVATKFVKKSQRVLRRLFPKSDRGRGPEAKEPGPRVPFSRPLPPTPPSSPDLPDNSCPDPTGGDPFSMPPFDDLIDPATGLPRDPLEGTEAGTEDTTYKDQEFYDHLQRAKRARKGEAQPKTRAGKAVDVLQKILKLFGDPSPD